jgi:hypothetical protein
VPFPSISNSSKDFPLFSSVRISSNNNKANYSVGNKILKGFTFYRTSVITLASAVCRFEWWYVGREWVIKSRNSFEFDFDSDWLEGLKFPLLSYNLGRDFGLRGFLRRRISISSWFLRLAARALYRRHLSSWIGLNRWFIYPPGRVAVRTKTLNRVFYAKM